MSLRNYWLMSCATVCALSTVSVSAQTESSSEKASVSQPESRLYQPGETYYESNLNRSLGSSENALEKQYRQTAEARQQLLLKLAAHRKALSDYGKTKTQLLREYDQSPELVVARKKLAMAEQDYQVERSAIIQRLHQSPEYRELVALRQQLSAKLQQLADRPITSEERQVVAKNLAEAMALMKELQEQVLISDSSAIQTMQQRQASLDLLARLKANSRESVLRDERFTSASLAKERTRRNLDLQKREFLINARQLLQTQNGYQQLVQQRLVWEESQRNSRTDSSVNNWASYWPWIR